MKVLIIGALAVGMSTSALAAGELCTQPRDKSAFDVAGLKTELMVIALTCDVRDKYNSFVMRYRTELQMHEKSLNGYFSHAYGRRGQQQHDDYITQLANAQSETGLARGTLFCQENIGLFDEVLGLPAGADLAGFASSKNLVQPIALTICPTPPAKGKAGQNSRSAQNQSPTQNKKTAEAPQ